MLLNVRTSHEGVESTWSSCCLRDPEHPGWGNSYIPPHLDTDAPTGKSEADLAPKIHENPTLGSMCLGFCFFGFFIYKNNKFSSNPCSGKTCYAHHVILSMFPPPLVLLDMCHGHRVPEQKMQRTEESQQDQAGGQAAPAGGEDGCQSCPVTW